MEEVIPYMKEVKFFKDRDIDDIDFPHIINVLSYQFNTDEECIINYGELGDKFYILLKG